MMVIVFSGICYRMNYRMTRALLSVANLLRKKIRSFAAYHNISILVKSCGYSVQIVVKEFVLLKSALNLRCLSPKKKKKKDQLYTPGKNPLPEAI